MKKLVAVILTLVLALSVAACAAPAAEEPATTEGTEAPAAEAAATRITTSPRMLVVRNSVEEKQKTARVTPSSSNNAAILPEN